MEPQIRRKSSLCRFYLRGICTLPAQQCHFSHGIKDLDYQKWHQGQEVHYDHIKDVEFNQKKTIKQSINYINLYEYQSEKVYTLEEINTIRDVRVMVRAEMHKQLFGEFMNLLQKEYPDANFTEQMLTREYYRAGFNKLMTRIKLSHFTDHLCQGQNPLYYMKSIVMPPHQKQAQNFIFRRASEPEIIECYKNELKRLTESMEGQVNESNLKKALFQMTYPNFKIPPLMQVLKQKQINFREFLDIVSKGEATLSKKMIKQDISIEEIAAKACLLIDINSKQKLLNWAELYILLTKQLKINNGNIINQCKPLIVLQGYYFMHFPMLQFITKENQNYPFDNESLSTCKCNLKEQYNLTQYEPVFIEGKRLAEEGSTVDINDWNSLVSCAKILLESKQIAVDVEGNLRKGGTIQMVQINNGRNTFLLDFYSLFSKNDVKTVQMAKKILRNVFANENILKVFHDCRHDSLVIHEVLNTCILNIFDTSAIETMKNQLKRYKQANNENGAKNAIAKNNNVRTWGLNDILKRYKASHGVNIHKERFHSMWSKGQEKFFLKRPMDHDYRQYCIFDVLDLLEVRQSMVEDMDQWQERMGKWVSSFYVAFGFQHSMLSQ